MDDTQFDALTRALGTGAGRRRILGALIGGTLASLLGGLEVEGRPTTSRRTRRTHNNRERGPVPVQDRVSAEKKKKKKKKKKRPLPSPSPGDCTAIPAHQGCVEATLEAFLVEIEPCRALCTSDPVAAACCENGEACCPEACTNCLQPALTYAQEQGVACAGHCPSRSAGGSARVHLAQEQDARPCKQECCQAELAQQQGRNALDALVCLGKTALTCWKGSRAACGITFGECTAKSVLAEQRAQADNGCPGGDACTHCVNSECVGCRGQKSRCVAHVTHAGPHASPITEWTCECPEESVPCGENECCVSGEVCCPETQVCGSQDKPCPCPEGQQACGVSEGPFAPCCLANELCCNNEDCVPVQNHVCCDCSGWSNSDELVVSACTITTDGSTTIDLCFDTCDLLYDLSPIFVSESESTWKEESRENGLVMCDEANLCRRICRPTP